VVSKKQKGGYLKTHVAVNIKTKEILALEVTGEKVHDGRTMRRLGKHMFWIAMVGKT
jgi:hypothetical protein